MYKQLSILTLATLTSASLLHRRGPTCTNVTIPVSIVAQNLAIPTIDNATDLSTTINGISSSGLDLATNLISGTYGIRGTYCEPAVSIPSRANTIQLLVHGITYTREYWTGQDGAGQEFGDGLYSWVNYASQHGFPTLAIDRLGNGISDRPDGIAIVQLPAQVEVTHALVAALKGGEVGGRAFEKVLFVGHSYGSLVGNAHSANYPDDVDAYILTGYTSKLKPSIASIVVAGLFLPAAVVLPARFGKDGAGYFAASSEDGANALFFTNNSDPAFRESIWENRGTVTVGETITAFLSEDVASEYKGDVFVLTGQNDAIFCSPDALGLGTLTGHGDCGEGKSGLIEETKAHYPNVRTYDFFSPEDTGHCNIQHYGAQSQFDAAFGWLQRTGY